MWPLLRARERPHKFKLALKDKKNLFEGQSNASRDFEKLIFTVNFKEIYNDNGQHHNVWEEQKLLSLVIDKFKHYCGKTMKNVYDDKFKAYHSWPPTEKTEFKPPKRFPGYQTQNWASMHIKGAPCVVGYMIENVFYVTWFDREHQFWLSPLKNT